MRAVSPSPTIITSGVGRARRLLVVEDECLIALNMVEQLVELGYTVVGPAFTIEEAKHLAAVALIDAAVVDLNLRGVSADEVADILALREIPFIFVTGYNQIPDRRFRDISILTKPFQILDLHQALEEMLANASQFAVVHAAQSQERAQASK